MTLVNCPECNRRVSDQAPACPECGHPIAGGKSTRQREPPGSDSFSRGLGWGAGLLIGVLLAVLFAIFAPAACCAIGSWAGN